MSLEFYVLAGDQFFQFGMTLAVRLERGRSHLLKLYPKPGLRDLWTSRNLSAYAAILHCHAKGRLSITTGSGDVLQ